MTFFYMGHFIVDASYKLVNCIILLVISLFVTLLSFKPKVYIINKKKFDPLILSLGLTPCFWF